MRIMQEEEDFRPVTIVLETREEVFTLYSLLGMNPAIKIKNTFTREPQEYVRMHYNIRNKLTHILKI